jgi:hypothetical protein
MSDLDKSIERRIAIIEALDKQIEAVLNHCPDIEVHEVIHTDDRESIEVIFSHVMSKGII